MPNRVAIFGIFGVLGVGNLSLLCVGTRCWVCCLYGHWIENITNELMSHDHEVCKL